MTDTLPWLSKAKSLLGTKEIVGPKHNPEIVALWKTGSAGAFKDDETPWCAAFVSAVLEMTGIRSARTGWARAYTKWGVHIPGPAVGAIVVFSRGTGGHVGFVVGKDKAGNLLVLGGNQGNAVTIAPFATGRVLAYRWPPEKPLPIKPSMATLPVISAAKAKLSTNEA